MLDFNIGDRVRIQSCGPDGNADFRDPRLQGRVVGATYVEGAMRLRSSVIVRLDSGFWNDRQTAFIHDICVHPGNLEPINAKA